MRIAYTSDGTVFNFLQDLKTLGLSRIDHPWFCPQTKKTAYLLSQGGLLRPKLTRDTTCYVFMIDF